MIKQTISWTTLPNGSNGPKVAGTELRLSVLDELSAFLALPNDARERLGLPPLPQPAVVEIW